MFPDSVDEVAFAGDWHANTSYAMSVIRQLPKSVDVVVHTGDFGYQFDYRTLDEYEAIAVEYDVKIMFVDGNHENFDRLYSYPLYSEGHRVLSPHVWHLPRGFRWVWNGVSFLALGGAVSIDKDYRKPFKEWWPQERIDEIDMRKAMLGGHADIMVTHDTPAGYEIPGLLPAGMFSKERYDACEAHRERMRKVVDQVKPNYLIHGHYHSRYNHTLKGADYETEIFGLDCDNKPVKDNYLIVDLDYVRNFIL